MLNIKPKLKALLIAGALGCAALAAPAAANAREYVVGSNMCLDAPYGKGPVQLQVWQCWGGPNQQWDMGPGGYTLKNRQSGLCLAVKDDNTNSTTPAIQATCSSSADAEQFIGGNNPYNPYGKNVIWNHWISWPLFGHYNCLDVLYARFSNGNPVDFFQCNGTAAQGWN